MCVRGADKVGLHVIDAALRIHQVLLVFAFNLNHTHNHPVYHVNGLTFLFVSRRGLLLLFFVLNVNVVVVLLYTVGRKVLFDIE